MKGKYELMYWSLMIILWFTLLTFNYYVNSKFMVYMISVCMLIIWWGYIFIQETTILPLQRKIGEIQGRIKEKQGK